MFSSLCNNQHSQGCLITIRPIGIMGMIDSGDKDYKILAVPTDDPRFAEIKDIDDVPESFKRNHAFLQCLQGAWRKK